MSSNLSRRSRIPQLHLHKAKGLAYAPFNDKQAYFGNWNTDEAGQRYQRHVAE